MNQIIVKLFFVLFIFIFSAEKVWAADTSTSDISYYFSLESRGFSGDSSVVEPDPEPKPCSLTCPNGELDEVNCLCICPYGTGKNGACCPNPGKDAARCLTALQLDGNGCDTYVSACSDGKVCDGAGQCVCAGVCDLENYAWDEACTCQCILDANACTSGISYFVNDVPDVDVWRVRLWKTWTLLVRFQMVLMKMDACSIVKKRRLIV